MFKEELKTLKHRDERFKNIDFTFEVENEVDGKPGIPFCDVRLMCDYVKACIRREVYRKLSNTFVYLNEKSNGPQYLKDGILRGFLHRNDIVSSTPEAHAKELELLANIFIRNGYDPERVDRIISSWVPKAERGNTTREDRETETQGQEEEARVVLKVPYAKGASEKLKKSLKKAAGVDVVFSGGVSIKQKLCAKLKPAKDPMEKQGTVYMIPCKDCSRPYIGETKQPLGERVKQHKAKTAAADMLNGPAYHTFHHDHKVDFEGALILDTEKQTWLRKTKEALFIRAANPGRELTQVMNQDRGYTISKCWDWAIPETRRKMEWAQRKKNPRPSDHS